MSTRSSDKKGGSFNTALNARIAANAKLIRERTGLSLRQAQETAEAAGHKALYTYIGRAERGEVAWNFKLIEALSAAYGVQPESFLLGPEEAHLVQAWRTAGQTGVILALGELAQSHADDP